MSERHPTAPRPDAGDLTAHELNAIDEAASREAYYQAFFASGLEQTKSLFTLASAGVGFTVQVLFNLTPKVGAWAPRWILFAGVLFTVVVALSIWVLRINSVIVKHKIKRWDAAREDRLVQRADLLSRILFGAGLVFLLFAGVAHLWIDGSGVQ